MRKAALLLLLSSVAFAQTGSSPDALHDGFLQPPDSAKPRVWWHWMNGNISKEGIRLDLEWMHRVGIGGFQNFDAALSTPQVVDHRLAYMTPEWKDAFKYATTLADQFGMEEAIAGSPGWSETGGPWVPPSEAMKKYVWSETLVEGGKPFTGTLAHPPTATGKFQNTPATGTFKEPEFYADSAVIAYRTPAADTPLPTPVFTASDSKPVNAAVLSDENAATSVAITRNSGADGKPWLQIAYPQPVTVRAVTTALRVARGFAIGITLQASEDGATFHTVTSIQPGGAPQTTLSFAPVTAKYFRLVFEPRTPGNEDLSIGEFVLHSGPRVNRFEEKAAFQQTPDLYAFATPDVDPAAVIDKSSVVDLPSRMKPDGSLDWTPPAGRWCIIRIGYSLLGITNHPATAEATGLEVDKLDHTAVAHYMDGYLNSYRDTVGADEMGKRGIRYVITDSWEAGTQNWTANLLAEFRKRRGYDPTPYLPVLTGRIVESSRASDAFLWDLRKTIADLTADEHYGQIEASLKARGMGHYGESHESGRAFIADGMEVKKLDDIPMGAMWTQPLGQHRELYNYNADDRESASVAHIYGQNLAAAESMTARIDSAWAWSPATLKPTADQEFLNGINRIVIHESAHQPLVGHEPGLTLGPYGQWFNRNETWADVAGPWVDYLARTSYMLQQGRFAADLLYFYGEDSNVTAIFAAKAPDVPAGHGFDYIDADGLIHAISVQRGQLATASGMSYRLLVLDPYSRHMSLPVLRAIHSLVEAGAIVAGPKPADTPSLADNLAEFTRLSNELFGDGTGVHTVGKGRVYAGADAAAALHALNLAPDFDYTKPKPDTRIEFVHRKLPDADIYFLDNRSERDETFDASFRITGKAPELWRAETGTSESASYSISGSRTTVPLHLEPWGSVFVVFRHAAATPTRTIPAPTETKLATLSGPESKSWNVTFQPGRGAPASATFDNLISWPDSPDPGIRYFSGAATYTRTLNAPADWLQPGAHIWLDLGDVKNLASITLNGKPLGVTWHAPYRIDITSALKSGDNALAITVYNAWVNRLIGDQQPGATKYTYADITPYRADSPLLPSGLLGPVQVLRVSTR
jgi:hypothetical protein